MFSETPRVPLISIILVQKTCYLFTSSVINHVLLYGNLNIIILILQRAKIDTFWGKAEGTQKNLKRWQWWLLVIHLTNTGSASDLGISRLPRQYSWCSAKHHDNYIHDPIYSLQQCYEADMSHFTNEGTEANLTSNLNLFYSESSLLNYWVNPSLLSLPWSRIYCLALKVQKLDFSQCNLNWSTNED